MEPEGTNPERKEMYDQMQRQRFMDVILNTPDLYPDRILVGQYIVIPVNDRFALFSDGTDVKTFDDRQDAINAAVKLHTGRVRML